MTVDLWEQSKKMIEKSIIHSDEEIQRLDDKWEAKVEMLDEQIKCHLQKLTDKLEIRFTRTENNIDKLAGIIIIKLGSMEAATLAASNKLLVTKRLARMWGMLGGAVAAIILLLLSFIVVFFTI